jgi:peptidoglycan/xylan/chitin deacetylase (PgdA/CDA1 family)
LGLLHHRVRPAPPDEVEAVIDAVVAGLGAPAPPADARSMSLKQLQAMARLPGAEIGAHTLSHAQLRGQREAVRRQEVLGSVERLAALINRPVTTFAYPYGSPRAVDRGAQRLVREAGCDLACSTDLGVARPGRRRYLLPRMAVGNWSGAELAARIAAVRDRYT